MIPFVIFNNFKLRLYVYNFEYTFHQLISPGDALIDLNLVKCKQNSCNLAVSTAAEVVKFNPEWRCKHVNTDEIGFNRNSSRNEVDDTLWWLLKYFRILLGSFEHVVRIASYHWTSSPNHLKPNQKQKISQDHM